MTSAEWFKQLYDENAPSVYRLAARRLRDHHIYTVDADDVLQEVFLLALKQDISAHPCPAGWLIRATDLICQNLARRNRCRQKLQLAASRQSETSSIDTPESISISVLDSKAALGALETQLTPNDWTLLKTYASQEITAAALAKQQGISVNTLRVRIHRLRSKLKGKHPDRYCEIGE